MRGEDQFHVGIVVEDLAAARAGLSAVLGYQWCAAGAGDEWCAAGAGDEWCAAGAGA